MGQYISVAEEFLTKINEETQKNQNYYFSAFRHIFTMTVLMSIFIEGFYC